MNTNLPTGKVELVTTKLLEKPELAFAVAQELYRSLVGPWVPTGFGGTDWVASRLKVHGSLVFGVFWDGKEASYGTRDDQRPAKTITEAMGLADERLKNDFGYTLVGGVPARIGTHWSMGVANGVRHHEVPSKLTKWPAIASVRQVKSGSWAWEVTQQGTMAEEGLGGLTSTYNDALVEADGILKANGWFLPRVGSDGS